MKQARITDREARLNRIGRRGVPELIQALERGEIGIKTAERIARLSKKEQRLQVTQRLEARVANERRQTAWRNRPLKRGKSLYASASYSLTKERRLRRIGRSAILELTETFNAGGLSLRQYDLLSRLSPTRQRKALQAGRHRKEGQELAARVIHSLLAKKERAIDLASLEAKIIESIRFGLC
jgi:hypothetical protein